MKLKCALLPCFSILVVLAIGPKSQAAEPESLPAPWKHQDIGAVEVKGTAAFHDGGFTLKGSMDTWGTNDGFQFVWQPFRGDGDLMGQLIGGHVDFASVTLASAAAAGPSVRVIGIFADKRNPSLPDAPTVKEQGYDVAPTSFGGLFAPAGAPGDVMSKLSAGCKFAVEQPAYADLAKRLHQGSNYYADAATFAKRLDADVADKKELLQRVGLIK